MRRILLPWEKHVNWHRRVFDSRFPYATPAFVSNIRYGNDNPNFAWYAIPNMFERDSIKGESQSVEQAKIDCDAKLIELGWKLINDKKLMVCI